MHLIRLIIVFLPLIHYLTSYKKVKSNSLFSGASIIWTSESQCLLTPFSFFHFFFILQVLNRYRDAGVGKNRYPFLLKYFERRIFRNEFFIFNEGFRGTHLRKITAQEK